MGINLGSWLLAGGILGIIQCGIFFALPNRVKDIMAAVPLVGVSMNWLASCIILAFSGTGMFISLANFLGSIFFAIVLLTYKHVCHIGELELVWKGIRPIFKIEYK